MNVPSVESAERPLRECVIWPLIEEFYAKAGPQAFDETPYYPTNNAFIAEIYADLIVAFYLDIAERLDVAKPVYIIEWASGVGLLGFLVASRLEERWPKAGLLAGIRWVYVLTDFTESNLAAWQADPQLAPLLRSGKVDYALFRPEHDDDLSLRCGRTVIGATALKNPPIVIANYFFDSIRHDYFRVKDGTLFEARVKVIPAAKRAELLVPAMLADLKLQERYVKVDEDAAYYPEPSIRRTLEKTGRLGDSVTSFLFPIGALRCLERLSAWSADGFGLLVSDKGHYRDEYIRGEIPLPYTPHSGSFSFMVNFAVLEAYLSGMGGHVFKSPENLSLTTVVARTTPSQSPGRFEQLAEVLVGRLALSQSGLSLGELASVLPSSAQTGTLTPRSLLTITRVACFDSWVFAGCGEALWECYDENEYGLRAEYAETLRQVERRLHRRAVGAVEAAHHLRRLHYTIGNLEHCLFWNEQLRDWIGEERDTHFYRAAVSEIKGDLTGAFGDFERAANLDPSCSITNAALGRVRRKLEGGNLPA